MSTVFMHAVVSVDGFIADAEDNVGPLFEWYFNGDAEIVDGGPFKVSRDSVRYVRPMWQRVGTTVMGRHLFDRPTGGTALRRPANIVDKVAMDVAPVVFGRGKRYFGALDAQQLLEDSDVVIQGRRGLHSRYRCRRRLG